MIDLLNRTALLPLLNWLPVVIGIGVFAIWTTLWGALGGFAGWFVVAMILDLLGLSRNAIDRSRWRVAHEAAAANYREEFPNPPPPSRFFVQAAEGDVVLHEAEIGMGGPIHAQQMLRDGAIIEGTDGPWRDIPGTSLRMARLHHYSIGDVVAIYDEVEKTLSRWNDANIGESGRRVHHALDSGGDIHDLLHTPPLTKVALKPLRGLWLLPDHYPPQGLPAEQLQRTLPSGTVLSARLVAPADLRTHANPTGFIYSQPYALALYGQQSGRHVSTLGQAYESPDGRWLVVGGVRLHGWGTPWLLHHQGQWLAVEHAVASGQGRTYREYDTAVVELADDGTLTLQAMSSHAVSHGSPERVLGTLAMEVRVEGHPKPLSVWAKEGRFALVAKRLWTPR